jgi:F-type H+-transporting ATPase subunit alpha
MKQKQYAPFSLADQAVAIFASNEDFLTDVPVNKIGDFETALLAFMRSQHGALMTNIDETANYDKDIEAELRKGITAFKATQAY